MGCQMKKVKKIGGGGEEGEGEEEGKGKRWRRATFQGKDEGRTTTMMMMMDTRKWSDTVVHVVCLTLIPSPLSPFLLDSSLGAIHMVQCLRFMRFSCGRKGWEGVLLPLRIQYPFSFQLFFVFLNPSPSFLGANLYLGIEKRIVQRRTKLQHYDGAEGGGLLKRAFNCWGPPNVVTC